MYSGQDLGIKCEAEVSIHINSHPALLGSVFNPPVNCSGKTRREYSLVRNSVACFESKSIECFACCIGLSTDKGNSWFVMLMFLIFFCFVGTAQLKD